MIARKVAANTGIQLITKGGLLLVSMATFALLTRYLGPERYGRYNLVLNVFGLAAIIADLGLSTIAIREIAAQREEINKVLPALFIVRLALSVLSLLAAVLLAWALGYDRDLVRLIGLYSLIFVIRGFGSGTFGPISLAALRAWKNMLADAAEALLFAFITAIGVSTHRDIDWFILGAVCCAIVGSAIMIYLTRHEARPSTWQIDRRYCFYLLRQAAPLALAGLFSVLYFRLDAIMLSKLGGASAVGIYGAAYKYIESTSLINASFLSSIFPLLSHSFERDKAKFTSYYRQSLAWASAFAFSLGMFLYIFADPLISLLSGAAFVDSVVVLRILTGAVVLMFVNNIGIHSLFAGQQQSRMVRINLVAVIVKVAANLLAIPYLGPAGAAAATVLTEMMIAVGVFVGVHRLHGLPAPISPLGKLFGVALGAVALLDFLHPDLAGRAALAAACTGAFVVIGVPKPQQISKLLQSARG